MHLFMHLSLMESVEDRGAARFGGDKRSLKRTSSGLLCILNAARDRLPSFVVIVGWSSNEGCGGVCPRRDVEP